MFMGLSKSKEELVYQKIIFDGNIQEPGYCSPSSKGICAPIVGYQVLSKCKKLVIHVMLELTSWYVFRTYSDFARFNKKLHKKYPEFCLNLPKQKRIGSKYSKEYLKTMQHKLQLYFDVVIQHDHISGSDIMKDFLQLENPPGPFHNIEQSKLHCRQLENYIDQLTRKVKRLEHELVNTKFKLNESYIDYKFIESIEDEAERNKILNHIKNNKHLEINI